MIERQYWRDIRKLYVAWLNEWLTRISQQTGVKLDALSDAFAGLFSSMAADWANRVSSFTTRIREYSRQVAGVAQIVSVTAEPTINAIMPEPAVLDDMQDFAAENATLITKIGAETTERVKTLVIDAVKNGTPTRALAKEIAAIDTAFGKNRARLIARDQIGKLQGQITRTRYEAAGLDEYEWMTAGDERVRGSHRALDGTTRKWTQNPTPGSEIQCRCVAV